MTYSVVITDLYDHKRYEIIEVKDGEELEKVMRSNMSSMDAFINWIEFSEELAK